jgi:hypothetical protein
VPLEIPGVTSSEFAIVAGIGDIDGQAADDDLVVARPSIGTVYLFPGGGDVPIRTWTGPVGFGRSVAALFGTATFFGEP